MKNISYGLFFILLILFSGCKQKGEDNSSSSAEKSSHQPTGPQYTANYDRTKPTETIDVESTISTSSEVRLSEVASSIEYFQVGDDKYPVTDVVAVDGGFIALNKPKLYLYRQGKKHSTSYLYDNKPTFSATYCDTVYRLSDHRTITPVYNIHLGKYKASANYVINKGDKRNKAWINELRENPKGVFLKVHREGKSNKSGWLDNKDKENRDFPSEDYLMVYLKNKRQTKALPLTSQGITNDLDDGLPFWPDGQTDEYMYMIRSAKDLKQQVKLTGSPKQNTLKNFLSDLPDNQNVMIVVK